MDRCLHSPDWKNQQSNKRIPEYIEPANVWAIQIYLSTRTDAEKQIENHKFSCFGAFSENHKRNLKWKLIQCNKRNMQPIKWNLSFARASRHRENLHTDFHPLRPILLFTKNKITQETYYGLCTLKCCNWWNYSKNSWKWHNLGKWG